LLNVFVRFLTSIIDAFAILVTTLMQYYSVQYIAVKYKYSYIQL